MLAFTALGVALVPLLSFLLRPGNAPRPGAAGTVAVPSTPTEVTVTATVPVAQSPTPPKSHPPKRSSRPTRSAGPTPTSSPSPITHAPNGTYAQVVNVATGRCLDIRDGDLTEGTDVITAPCTSSATQLWRVDAARGVVQSSADSDLCLDSRESVEKGVGVWECDSVDGGHGDILRFTVDSDGVIRPAIAIETGVTPEGAEGVSLVPLSGCAEQRWRAG